MKPTPLGLAGPPGGSGSDPFQQAISLHRAGRLEEAVAAYRRASAQAPRNHGILCNLGIALKQSGRINDAIAAYRKALDLAPDFADAHYNLGIVLEMAGRGGEAEQVYRRAIALKPAFPAALANLANTLKRSGRLDEAEACYRDAIALKPDHYGALSNLGGTLGELGRFEEGVEICREALAIKPDFVAALCHLSLSLTALGRLDEAAATAKRALDLEPHNPQTLTCVANTARKSGNLEQGLAACQDVIARYPDLASAYCLAADLQLEHSDAESALAACEACLARHPAHIEALALKATALTALGRQVDLRRLTNCDRLIQAKQWDKTPDHPDLKSFNRALARHILDHPTLRYEPQGNATRQGRHSAELLIEPKGPIAQLEQMICSAVEDYGRTRLPDSSHPFLARPPQSWILTVWAVVLERQGFQIPHIHASGWLSGVYYVTLPDLIQDEAAQQAGWIEFGRPFLRHATDAEPEVKLFQPREGLMLLFPSYFLHRTLPFESNQTRISIAFDVMPRD